MKEVFAVALTLRLVLLASVLSVSGPSVLLLTDSREYLELAEALTAGRFERSGAPELLRLPGYPLFLIPGLLAGRSVAVGLLLQALLGGLIAVVACAIGRRLAGAHAGRCAGLLCACEPVLLAWGSYLMAETLLTACVSLSVLCAVRYSLTGSPRELLGAGAAACAAAYTKPVAIAFPLWLGLLLLVRALSSDERLRRLRHAAVFLCAATAVLAAWPVRNGLAAGYWGFSRQLQHLASAGAYELAARQATTARERAELHARFLPPGSSRGVFDQATENLAWRTLRAAWAEQLGTYARGVARVSFAPGATAYLELFGVPRRDAQLRTALRRDQHEFVGTLVQRAPVSALLWAGLGAWNAALLAMAAFALVSPRSQAGPRKLLAGCALYFVLASGGPWSQSRFRHPALPMLCTLAGLALAERFARRARREQAAGGALRLTALGVP
jgi:4-amino-4-deoxy-L-arabinose transferase-like glycosyltransferase